MRKNKLTHLLEPSLRLYFVFLLLFAAVSALFSVAVAVIEAAVVAVLYLYFRRSNAQRQKEIIKYIESVTCNMDKDTMVNAPLPMVIFRPENDEVIWSNDRFLQLTGEREHLFDTKITAAVPDFSSRWLMEGKTECPTEVRIGERRFLVFGHLVRTEDQGGRGYLATTYWVDVTDFAQVRDIYYSTRPVVGILTVDNYEELMKGATDSARSAMRSGIDERPSVWPRLRGCSAGTSGTATSLSLRSGFWPSFRRASSPSWRRCGRWSAPRASRPPCPSASARTPRRWPSCSSTRPCRWRWP